MKAMILAAGLGTRLKPWTDLHPKALVPVENIPMLERVINNLNAYGYEDITVNIHHFPDQITSFLKQYTKGNGDNYCPNIKISDESDSLLDTGGGICRAYDIFKGGPLLVHNVDILSNADLKALYNFHITNDDDVTLLVSNRDSSRKLLFSSDWKLVGWKNVKTGEIRWIGCVCEYAVEMAFSGIYILSDRALKTILQFKKTIERDAFPIMDFFLSGFGDIKIRGEVFNDLQMLDIGKPEALMKASGFLNSLLT